MNYIYILFLIVLFFLYGLFLSIFINFLFSHLEDNQPEYLVLIETLVELAIVYIVYFYMQHYIDDLINILIPHNTISYLNQLFLFSFSLGIYYYLKKNSAKMQYFQNKYIYHKIKKNKYYKNIKEIFSIKYN
jgi:hypothetical protein